MPDAVPDVTPRYVPSWITGYIEAWQSLLWRRIFDPGPYAWTWSGWWRYGSLSGETEPPASGSGEAEFLPRGWARRSLRPWCRVRRNLPLEVGRGGVRLQGSGEAEPAALRSGEMEPTTLGSGETEPAPKGSGEMEPVALGSGETF